MKNLLLILVLALPLCCLAQDVQGVITYEQKVNLHKRLDEDSQDMKSLIPEFQTSKSRLFFTATESLYTALEEEEPEEEAEDHGGGVRIRLQRPSNIIYFNLQENQRTEQRDFFGKKFLLEEPAKPISWKMSAETKEIFGYPCVKAAYRDEEKEREVEAWFTSAIPCPAGPESFGQLPGMILEVNINDGEMLFTAVEVEMKELDEGAITPPAKGKKITEEEYRKMMDERMREMGASGKGGIRIIRRTN